MTRTLMHIAGLGFAVLLTGCQTTGLNSHAGFKSTVRITPGSDKGTYMLEGELTEVTPDGERTIARPRLLLEPGEPATIWLTDNAELKHNGIFVEARIPKQDENGPVEYSIELREDGITKHLSAFQMTRTE